VTPNTIYAFSYTSGTTGQPKGAMLSHKNMVSTVYTSKSKLVINEKTVYLSYLPMAHSFERVIINTIIALGGKIGLYQGNNLKLLDDIALLKPTIFSSVPRILNKIYDKIH
jgi:long-chain acyl-CoA synthetase